MDNIYCYRATKEEKFQKFLLNEKRKKNFRKKSIATSSEYVDVYLYYPSEYNEETLPVYFNFHGGGFVLGYCEQDGPACQFLADHANCIVVNVDYLLAPEHKFPEPTVTSAEVILSILKRADEYSIDADKVVIGGHSAGGSIAISACLQLRDLGHADSIKGIIADYVPVNLTISEEEEIQLANDRNVDRMTQYKDWYLVEHGDGQNPLATPLYADLKGFPAFLIISAEYDPLRKDEEVLADKLRKENVDVTYKCFEGCQHGFTHVLFEYNEEQAKKAWKLMGDFLIKCFREI